MKQILRASVLGVLLLGSLRMSGQISTIVETIPTGTVCTGSEFTFVFTANDTRSNDNKYNVYVYRSSYEPAGTVNFSEAVQTISNVGAFSAAAGGGRNRRTATVQFDPQELSSGSYKIWIFAQTSDSRATKSSVFPLSAAPALSITGLATNPLYGQAARIRFAFTGNGGYTFAHRTNLIDGILPYRSNPPNPFDFDFTLGNTSYYFYDQADVVQFSGTCGSGRSKGVISGYASVTSQKLSITFGSISQPSTCPGAGITVPFSVNGAPPAGTK
ncbi:MAG: hypothetical protein LH606_13095 [Cytophagaceae bacterium]|nr:hypothetical protein [Cytophagaceae bacterium]